MADDDVKDVEQLLTDVPVAEPAKEPEPQPEPKAAEQPRDEGGKFAAKDAKETPTEPKATPLPETAKTELEDKDGQVPSWRLREVAEERRVARAEADALKAEMAETRRQLAALQKPAEQPKQEDIDPLLDPQGFAKRMQDSFAAQLREERLNNNLALTHVKHGETFEKAYNAFLAASQSGDRVSWSQVMNSPNPGESMVQWHKQRETLKEVGSDPAAYRQKLQDELLKNPEFLAKAIEAARTSAGAQPRQNNVTQLPPSLSRATGSSAEPSDTELSSVEALLAR